MTQYVFIHGAWHASWCWEKVIPILQRKGHSAIALDVPSHGASKVPKTDTSVDSISQYVQEFLAAQPAPSVLVGHSWGGLVISQVAERAREHVAALVYVTAFLPKTNESLQTYASQDAESVALQIMIPLENGLLEIDRSKAPEAFYNCCTSDDALNAADRLEPHFGKLLEDTVELTPGKFGAIPKYYVKCKQDKIITPQLQDLMCNNWPIVKTKTLNSDHSPFLSEPKQLARFIGSIAP